MLGTREVGLAPHGALSVAVLLQLLDISELDTVGAGREAKRRRKTLGA